MGAQQQDSTRDPLKAGRAWAVKVTLTPTDGEFNTFDEAGKIVSEVSKSLEKLLLSLSDDPRKTVIAIGEISLEFVVLVPDEDQQQGGQDA